MRWKRQAGCDPQGWPVFFSKTAALRKRTRPGAAPRHRCGVQVLDHAKEIHGIARYGCSRSTANPACACVHRGSGGFSLKPSCACACSHWGEIQVSPQSDPPPTRLLFTPRAGAARQTHAKSKTRGESARGRRASYKGAWGLLRFVRRSLSFGIGSSVFYFLPDISGSGAGRMMLAAVRWTLPLFFALFPTKNQGENRSKGP